MKIVFLDAGTMGNTPMDEIAALGEFVVYNDSSREESLQRASDCEVAIVNKVLVDKTFLDHAPLLKLVCEAGTGINNINVQECSERGVIVRNVAGYSTDSVAQNAIMHILNLLGRAFLYDERVKSGAYSAGKLHTDAAHPFIEAAGKTLGIVGMGAIGQKVAGIATALGMKVIYYSTSGTSHCTDYPSVSLDELLERSDVVSIHAPLNDRTRSLIGLEQMRNRPYPQYDMVTHDVTLPFIRFVAGPGDYTPGAFLNGTRETFVPYKPAPMSQGTRCRQLAQYVVFDGPMQMISDGPCRYEAEPECAEFIYRVPTVWDETRVLEGRIGEYIVTARRKGDVWYIGAMTGWTARELTIDLSSLYRPGEASGEARVEAWEDGPDASRNAQSWQKRIYENASSLKIQIAPGGGWAGIIKFAE